MEQGRAKIGKTGGGPRRRRKMGCPYRLLLFGAQEMCALTDYSFLRAGLLRLGLGPGVFILQNREIRRAKRAGRNQGLFYSKYKGNTKETKGIRRAKRAGKNCTVQCRERANYSPAASPLLQ